MVTILISDKIVIFLQNLEKQKSWTFIWTFLRCVKMVFFRGLFRPFFLSINVGTLFWKTILTQRAEVCQKFLSDFLLYKNVGQNPP